MSAPNPARPSRRATARRTAIGDSDSDNDLMANSAATVASAAREVDEYSPETKRKSRGASRPTAARGRPRKVATPAPDGGKPGQAAGGERVAQQSPDGPSRTPSPRKRASVAPRPSVAPTPHLAPPTPKLSMTPEPSRLQASPLDDITAASFNAQAADETQAAPIKPVKPFDTVMDKPMDIMLKQRTATVPVAQDAGAPKRRIVLIYLILNNFKSYAGRQEVGPFHASFSSVVGPNGSGKSNVIDSLLFVFGFRASKMRQGKISALIHNSAQHPNLEFCEVEVHFQEVVDQVCYGLSAAAWALD